MLSQIHQHLSFLYGTGTAAALAPKLEEMVKQWQPRLVCSAPARLPLPLSQRDVMLITYADQVRAAGLSPLRALGDFAGRHLEGVVSGIHLLPFYPWSSDDGFSVKEYLEVDPGFGAWEDIQQLAQRFDLMFDAVFNHLSAQSGWFSRFLAGDPAFCNFFVTVEGEPDLSQVVRPRALPLLTEYLTAAGPRKVWTTFSADQVDLNFKNPEVLMALIETLLFYVSKGARFVRLDAIAFLWKEPGTRCLHLPQTHAVIQLLRALLDRLAPHVLLITETNVPHADNISYFGDGTNEAQLVYNFALPPLVLHSLATGRAEQLTTWAQSLALPSSGVTFFNFLASHDGIGLNPARGILAEAEIEALAQRALAHGGYVSYKNNPDGSKSPYELNVNYFDALSSPSESAPMEVQVNRFLCAHAIMLSLAGLPGLYFHSLFGSRGDRAGAEASGIARRINRQKLERQRLESELSDPATLRARVWTGLRQLLCARRSQAAFHPCGRQEVKSVSPHLFAIERSAPEGPDLVLCLHNVSAHPVETRLKAPPSSLPHQGSRLAGSGDISAETDNEITARLGPYQFVWWHWARSSPPS